MNLCFILELGRADENLDEREAGFLENCLQSCRDGNKDRNPFVVCNAQILTDKFDLKMEKITREKLSGGE